MPRRSADITQDSAVHIAKWRISDMLKKDKGMPWAKKMALNMALADGGAIEEIAAILYDCGLRISIDLNNTEHKSWLDATPPAVELASNG